MNATILKTLIAALAIALLGALGCSGDDTDDPKPTDNDDTSTATETTPIEGDPNCETTEVFPEDDEITAYPYPAGPGGYGFQTAMCPGLNPFWGSNGEAIHNVCLTDQDGNANVCLSDYYQSTEYDILIVDMSATWCGPCREMAGAETRFVDGMGERGWSIKWVTVLTDAGTSTDLTPPTQADAKWWQELGWGAAPPEFDQHGPVLWDAEQIWGAKVFSDWWPNSPILGYPAWFIVHPSNMLIWDTRTGLPYNFDPMNTPVFTKFMDDFAEDLTELSQNSGACATDPCVILGPQDTDSDTTN